ncbi:MAG: hypothetical protein JRI83_12120 [Deltaproteobacteria bacterium]|nr:hypothetical protein [Deltaproteobacteria bacterium]
MGSLNEHITKARHNENFIDSFDLDHSPFLDWAVNGIFYSALHYLDSYFAKRNMHPPNHTIRNQFINSTNLDVVLYGAYRQLRDDSRDARYETRAFTPDEIRHDILPQLKVIKNCLRDSGLQIP